ncbi:MAG TPA: M56 family metallopeptidase [Actinomycetota bacterium]|nr:M56 family metallopeptidase [Actinomycetota bacterium]
MGALLLLGGFGLLALPGLTVGLGRRLPPDEWARLCRGALVAGGVIVEVGSVLYALPTVLRAAGVPAFAAMCERTLRLFLPGTPAAGWAAGAAAVSIATLSGMGRIRARRGCRAARAEPWLGEHRRFGAHEVVTLPTDRILAVSVAGAPAQILISRGLVETLSGEQLELVLSHEVAHLDLNHERTLHLAAALDHGFAFFWPLRRSTQALRTALERWADEVAAGKLPGRRSVLHSALLGVTGVAVGTELAAFSPAHTVVERLRALEQPSPRPSSVARGLLYLPGMVAVGTTLVAMAAWSSQAWMLVSMAGRCPL